MSKKPKKPTQEELLANKRVSNIKLKQREFIPEPTRMFKVGDLVVYGRHQNSQILDIFDDGKFYEVKNWGIIEEGTKEAGTATSSVTFCSWTELFPIESKNNEEVLSLRNKFELSYFQQDIFSLLNKVYHFGVNFNPDYQRDLVWDDEDRTLLIDSIMTSRDIGKFVLMTDDNNMEILYEIVDGKQRLSTICAFYEDRFLWHGKKFSQLSKQDRNHFLHKNVSFAEVRKMPKKDILELFIFINDTGKVVSKDHLNKVKNMLKEVTSSKE